MRGAALFIAGAAIGAACALQLARPYDGPRLAGFGCLGAPGVLYADEESDFPRCAAIEPVGSDMEGESR